MRRTHRTFGRYPGHRVSAARYVLCLVVVLSFLVAPVISRGDLAFAQRAADVVVDVVVDAQTAQAHFPDTVDFALKAHGFKPSGAELNYRLVGDPVTAQLEVPVTNPSAANVSLGTTLDLSTHYIPPGADVTYYWTLTDNAGQTVYTPEQTFTMPDQRYNWQTLSDNAKGVSVHWYDGGRSFGNSLLGTASEALARLQTEIGSSPARPANVWVYASQDDLLGALPKNIPEWVGGKAFPELALVMASIAPDESATQEIKRVVPHELSHLMLYQATLNPYNTPPAWMDEGLAVHNQEAQDPAEELALKDAAQSGKLLPLKSLSGSFGADEDAATLSYAESRSVVDFILSDSRYGQAKFSRTVAAFKGGVTYDDALKAGLGITVDELDRQWRDSLPYKVASQATPGQSYNAPTGAASQSSGSNTPPWGTLAAIVGLGVCVGLFLAGGLLTLVMILRRRTV